METAATVARIYRYPVKVYRPEPLDQTALSPGQTVPLDRAYAIENGPSGFDPAAPAYFPKQRFLMLMRNERLASLATQLDEATHTLTIRQDGSQVVQGDLRGAPGRAAIEQFLASFCSDELRGPPKILHGSGHSFSDVARKVVSIINLASVAEIADAIGARSIRCASGPISTSRAGRRGGNSSSSTRNWRSAARSG